MFPEWAEPMFPGTDRYVPGSSVPGSSVPGSSVPGSSVPDSYVPGSYVPRYLGSRTVPMSGPQFLCSPVPLPPGSCVPTEPMFHGTYVLWYICSPSPPPPLL